MKLCKWTLNIFLLLVVVGCGKNNDTIEKNEEENITNLITYSEALELFTENTEAEVFDIESGITYNIRRVIGGFNTLAGI